MGSFLVPSNLPPECIGKDRLGLNPSTLTSTSCKSAFSLGCRRGECGGHCVSIVVASRPRPGRFRGCWQCLHSRSYQKSLPGQGSKAYSLPTVATRGQLSQKVKAVLARLRKFLTCGPSAGRVERTMSGPCPHRTGCQAASKASRHSTVVPHRCLEHRLLAES